MNNLIHHFPTCHTYSVKKGYRGLNLERALDEDTGIFLFFFCSTVPFISCIFHCICLFVVKHWVKDAEGNKIYTISQGNEILICKTKPDLVSTICMYVLHNQACCISIVIVTQYHYTVC